MLLQWELLPQIPSKSSTPIQKVETYFHWFWLIYFLQQCKWCYMYELLLVYYISWMKIMFHVLFINSPNLDLLEWFCHTLKACKKPCISKSEHLCKIYFPNLYIVSILAIIAASFNKSVEGRYIYRLWCLQMQKNPYPHKQLINYGSTKALSLQWHSSPHSTQIFHSRVVKKKLKVGNS